MPAARFISALTLLLMLSNTSTGETFRFRGRVDVISAGAVDTTDEAAFHDCTARNGDALASPPGSSLVSRGVIPTAAPIAEGSGDAQVGRSSEADPATTEREGVRSPGCVISVVYE